MTPSEVEALFESTRQPSIGTFEDEDGNIVLTQEEKSRRVEKLREVLTSVQQLVAAGSEELDLIAQRIGDGSRDVLWRVPLGESGLLEFFVGLIGSTELRQALAIHTLRIIGNSCADTDENRARVVASNCLPAIVNMLNDDSILAFVIPVLFNICVDYEPAQVAAYKAGLNPELVSLISSPRLANAQSFMNYICKLLGLIASQEPEANLVHTGTPFILLTLATSPQSLADLEDFLGQLSVGLTYLSNPQFQDAFLNTPQSIPLFLHAFSKACVNFDITEADESEATQLKNVQSVFTQALADLSANPIFAASCPIGGPEVQTMQCWISTPCVQLQSAACLALGNIARSDDACITLVQTYSIHKPLVAIIADDSNTDAQLLHSTLSFLKNLAIPVSNKPHLGEAGLLNANLLPRIWGLDTQIQVQFASVSLTRLLLVLCSANVQRMCAPLSDDPNSPAHERTLLHQLMSLFLRSDQEPTKTEAARAVLAVLRVLHSGPDAATLLPQSLSPSQTRNTVSSSWYGPETEVAQPATSSKASKPPPPSHLGRFYKNHDTLPNAILYLSTNTKFPVLRSELWFVMALMSRSPDGANMVATCLLQIDLLRSLLETVGGKEAFEARNFESAEGADSSMVSGLGLEPQQIDPSKKAGMVRVDRENCLVLIAELLQRCPEQLRPLVKESLTEVLRTGGQLVLDDRAAGAGRA
ncbi:uncharacterized protein BCR38DRAFT_347215 [Pseudomassariella vexata]|uniref:Armadillo-type protein n=1 Tax=Pseudomassariella vexata TaxID=1141098 RepID=A0A1Y2DRD7_9PEZI|nr:uncharacterized protein BCR38DRAFT_347215 [Pseudomassariella vexata]ORY61666.1 hypothetical protein BCR38DRAFT_347215 [Pseudomassariella vexata]